MFGADAPYPANCLCMVQTSPPSLPIGRIIAILLAAGAILAVTVRYNKTQIANAPAARVQDASTGYGCPEDAPLPEPVARPLKDATEEIGLTFTHTVGPLGTYYVPESVGSGAAWADFNNDGRLDLFLVNGERSPGSVGELSTPTRWAVYAGQGDGTLKDVSEAAGLDSLGFGMGAAVGDVDNDGDADIYVTCVKQDRLLLNDGEFRFRDVAVSAGITESEWGTGVSLFDYDRDGLLDIVVANYTRDDTYDHQISCGFRKGLTSYCGPHKFSPTVDRLYHNDGLHKVSGGEQLQVRFSDVTVAAGLSEVTTYGFATVTMDVNDDGWADILIANDSQPNRLWLNQQNGTFVEQAAAAGLGLNAAGSAVGSMGIAVGDIDRDQKLDFVISTLSTESSVLYKKADAGFFVDSTQLFGLNRSTLPHTGWGAAMVDLNHDGWLDMPLVNGLVIPCRSRFAPHGEDTFQQRSDRIEDSESYWKDYADRNLLIMSNGTLPLIDETTDSGGDFTRATGSGRSLLYGDPDNDGDLDLLVTNCGSRARFYRNEFPKNGHWIRLQLFDGERRRDAIGATVTIECGAERWTSSVTPCSSFLASHDVRVHFGIGNNTRVDRMIVHWPDGPVADSVEEFPGCEADADYRIVRGQGNRMRANP